MPTLQWMLALAFLHCLTAYPTNTMNFEQVEGIYKELITKNCAEHDAKFYSPSGDMSNKCIWGAMKCSISELDTVKSECFTQHSKEYRSISKMKDLLGRMLREHNKNSEDATCICESRQTEEKPYRKFLDNIITLYKKLNSL